MEPLALATVMIDDDGRIRAADGAVGGAVFGAEFVSRLWTDAFGSWGLSSLPETNDLYPCRLRGFTPGGDSVFVDLLRLPSAGAGPFRLAIFREDESTALSPRMQALCGIGEISCSVSHEIKNALTPVCGYLDLWRELGVQELPKFDLVQKEARRIAELTHNLQDVARGVTDEPEELDLQRLIAEVTGLFGREMEKSEIVMEARIDPELPRVRGTAGRLKQALINLLVNARHATPPGGHITVAAQKVNGHVELFVEDTGCGIPTELHARVFRTFYTTKPDGTGLGLPITKQIVEDHGGTIHLASVPGQGARFTISLPVRSTP